MLILDPFETLRVSGAYSSTYYALHLGKIVGWSIAGLALLRIIIGGSVALTRRLRANKKADASWTAILAGIIIGLVFVVALAGGIILAMTNPEMSTPPIYY